jgi:hypothetical protein
MRVTQTFAPGVIALFCCLSSNVFAAIITPPLSNQVTLSAPDPLGMVTSRM